MVAVWLPASSHALLEHAGLIHQVHAHHEQAHDNHTEHSHDPESSGSHEHDADTHAAADGLCLVAAGKVEVPTPTSVAVPGCLAVPVLAPLMQADFSALHAGLSPPGVAPPELSHRWQFSFRAALPVRAPSFVS